MNEAEDEKSYLLRNQRSCQKAAAGWKMGEFIIGGYRIDAGRIS